MPTALPGNAGVSPAFSSGCIALVRAGRPRSQDAGHAQAAPWGEIRQQPSRTDPKPRKNAVSVGVENISPPDLHPLYQKVTNSARGSDPRHVRGGACARWGFRRARLSRTLLGTASWERRVFQTRASRPQMGWRGRRRSMRAGRPRSQDAPFPGRAVPRTPVSGAALIRPNRVRPREPTPQREKALGSARRRPPCIPADGPHTSPARAASGSARSRRRRRRHRRRRPPAPRAGPRPGRRPVGRAG